MRRHAYQFVVKRKVPTRDLRPPKAGRRGPRQFETARITVRSGAHGGGKRACARLGEPRIRYARILEHATRIGQHHGHTGGHRFERSDPKRLARIEMDKHVAPRIMAGEGLPIEVPEQEDTALEQSTALTQKPAGKRTVASDRQPEIPAAAERQLAEHGDEQPHILLGGQPPGVEQEDTIRRAPAALQQVGAQLASACWGPNMSVSTPIGHTQAKSGARSDSVERSSAAVYSEMATCTSKGGL